MLGNLGIAISIALLGGFNGLAQPNTPTNNETPKNKQITFSEEYKYSDTKLVFIAKNYENNGQGVFYTGDTINRTTSARFNGQYTWTGATAIFDLTYGSTIYKGTQLAFTISNYVEEETQQTIYYLANNYLYTSGNSKSIYWANASSGAFSNGYSMFIGSNFQNYTDSFIQCVNRFYNVYLLGDSYFKFNTSFNFNAPYGYALSSPFISDDYFTSTNPGALKVVNIDLPFFMSNGHLYNQIKISYFNAYGTRYLNNKNTYSICDSEGYGYYAYMQYVNSVNNYTATVNLRQYGTYTDNDDNAQTYLAHTTQWKNQEYKDIQFITELTPEQSNSISILNTTSGTGYYYNSDTTSVFELIKLGFTTWTTLFSMQVGTITLSMLIMAPLLIGFIIWLIHLVKRG